jgi:16S rRNA (cytosine967-C5)-methyltransferase
MESFQRQLAEDEIGYSIVAGASNALTIHSKVFFRHPLYQEGTCFFMDPSSQNIPALAELDGCRRLGDFCSAPGGKSFVLASRMPREALLIASDFSQSRLLEMKSRSELCGIERIELVQADLARSAPFERSFDFVLTDVPCSGLGTIRSNPDIRWRVQPESLTTHQKRQLSILENGFSVLKEGGEILYSTCSTEPEENEHVIESFLSTCREARLVEPYFRTYPNQSAGDTFFAARVRRLGSACGKLHN